MHHRDGPCEVNQFMYKHVTNSKDPSKFIVCSNLEYKPIVHALDKYGTKKKEFGSTGQKFVHTIGHINKVFRVNLFI